MTVIVTQVGDKTWYEVPGVGVTNHRQAEVAFDERTLRMHLGGGRLGDQAVAVGLELLARGWSIRWLDWASTGSRYFEAVKGERRCRVRVADHGVAGFLPAKGLRAREVGRVHVAPSSDPIKAATAVERQSEEVVRG